MDLNTLNLDMDAYPEIWPNLHPNPNFFVCQSRLFPYFFHCVYKIESGFSTTLLVTAFSVLTSKTSVIVITGTHDIFVIRRSPAVNGRKENGGKIEQHPRPGQTNFPRTKVPGLKV